MSSSPAGAPYPKKLTLALTDRCNLKCFICTREEYEQGLGNKGSNMPIENVYKMEGPLREAEVIQLAGFGETFLHPQLEEVLDFIYSINPRKNLIYIISNGTLLSKKWAEKLGPRLNYLAISLNAAHPATYKRDMYPYLFRYTRETAPEAYKGKRFADDENIREVPCQFERTMSRVGEFMDNLDDEARARVGLHYVVHSENIDEMDDFVRLAKSVGGSLVEFNQYMVNRVAHIDYNIFFHKERYNASFRAAKTLGQELGVRVNGREFGTEEQRTFDPVKHCFWPDDEAMIMSVGNTPPCCHVGDGDMGNAVRHDFHDVWNGKAYRKLRRERWMNGCQSCNLFQTFDDWRIHFHPSVKRSPQFEELAGEVHEEVQINKPPRVLVLGAGRDGTRSLANLIANLHAANGREATVRHDGGSFLTFSGVTQYLGGDDGWMRNICRSWDTDVVAGNGFGLALPVIRDVIGGDVKVIHVRRNRDECIASMRRAALADPLLWDGYVEPRLSSEAVAQEKYDPVRPGAAHTGEMTEEEWAALNLDERLAWHYDATHNAIEENLTLFDNHLSLATEDLNDPGTIQRIARFVDPDFLQSCPPVHVNHGIEGPDSLLTDSETSRALNLLADFDYHRLAASDTYPVVFFLQNMIAAHAAKDPAEALSELQGLRGDIETLIARAEGDAGHLNPMETAGEGLRLVVGGNLPPGERARISTVLGDFRAEQVAASPTYPVIHFLRQMLVLKDETGTDDENLAQTYRFMAEQIDGLIEQAANT